MKIDLNELLKATKALINTIGNKNGNEIEVGADYYWSIAPDEIYNVYEKPKQLTLGQLSEDWETLQLSVRSNNLTPYDLQRISAILKAISIQYPI